MGWDDKRLPTHGRDPNLSALEQNFPALDRLMLLNRSGTPSLGGLERPEFAACVAPPGLSVAKTVQLEAILKAMKLDSGTNFYRQALDRAKDPKYLAQGRASVAAMNACWADAGKKYDAAGPDVQKFLDANENWDRKNWFRKKSAVDRENAEYAQNKAKRLANDVLNALSTCLRTHEPKARDYLNAIEALSTLENLQAFAKKATPAQKETFRKKVECESSPLL